MGRMQTTKNDGDMSPVYKVLSASEARKFMQCDEDSIRHQKILEIVQALRLNESICNETVKAQYALALERYASLEPSDGAEAMLATQMVGTHITAMECLSCAAVPGQTFEAREMNLKHAEKLMALYVKQVAALDKHRGKGQQKVTVEHVHVGEGGQAIVGNIEMGASSRAVSAPADVVEHQPEMSSPPDRPSDGAQVKPRKPGTT